MSDNAEPKSPSPKRGKTILSIAMLAVLVGGVLVYQNVGSLVKKTAEVIGSETLGVAVKINKVDVNFQSKSVLVYGIKVANPDGYAEPYAMKVALVSINADTLSKDLLSMTSIKVDQAEVFLEVNDEGTNLSSIKDNIKTKPKKASAESSSAPKVIIKKFALTDTKLHPKVTLVGKAMDTVTIPDFQVTGIGVKENGVVAQEAIATIWSELSQKALNASASAGFLQGLSPDRLKDITGSLSFTGSLKENETLNQAKDSIKGLFGN
jgi:hypothetical protein